MNFCPWVFWVGERGSQHHVPCRKLIDDANKYCFVIRKVAALDFLHSIPKKWKGYIIKVEAPQSVLQNYGLRKHKLVEFPVETVIFSSILPAVLSNLD